MRGRRCRAGAEVIDVGGAAVTPGLDRLAHPPFVPTWCAAPISPAVRRWPTSNARWRPSASASVAIGWVLGWGVSYEALSRQRRSSRALIDDAVGGAPAVVRFMDQHTSLASQSALATAGVTGAVEFTEGAEVVVRDGVPTGELRERAAMELVDAVVPASTDARAARADAWRRCAR